MPRLRTTVSYYLAFMGAVLISGTWAKLGQARPRGMELVYSPEKLLESETSFAP